MGHQLPPESAAALKICDAVIENIDALVNNYHPPNSTALSLILPRDFLSKMKNEQFETPGKNVKNRSGH